MRVDQTTVGNVKAHVASELDGTIIFIYILLVVGLAERTDGIVYCFAARQPVVERSVQQIFIDSGPVGIG
jgi:hypothetical protein